MTRRIGSTLAALALTLATAGPVLGDEPGPPADEATLELLVSTIQANKKALVAVNLVLEETEAAAFWSVYDRYQADLDGIALRFVTLVRDYTQHYKTMDDALSQKLVEESLAIEQDRTAVRRKYLKPFSEALSGRKVARFYQLENKLYAIVRYEIARGIPVIPD